MTAQCNTSQDGIEPKKYTLDSEFTFECHKGMKCYTSCCSGITNILTPYDIVRMKNRLGLSCDQFLAIYTKPEMLARTKLPVIIMKMLDDEKESCPFVTPEGCAIYEDRPLSCRYYPLGAAAFREQESNPPVKTSISWYGRPIAWVLNQTRNGLSLNGARIRAWSLMMRSTGAGWK